MLHLFTSKELPSSSENKSSDSAAESRLSERDTSRFHNTLFVFVKGNGPGGMSEKYLEYWPSQQCIGGSGHGGKGGYPAFQDILNAGYSGLEYGMEDTNVLLGGSSGTRT